ncbi:hypothetical protein ASE88_00045 [Sphingomonas sp. Leaf38]|nr:hypothetical protein ASE88_00045 [Sphingomonas sp. Leaf38]
MGDSVGVDGEGDAAVPIAGACPSFATAVLLPSVAWSVVSPFATSASDTFAARDGSITAAQAGGQLKATAVTVKNVKVITKMRTAPRNALATGVRAGDATADVSITSIGIATIAPPRTGSIATTPTSGTNLRMRVIAPAIPTRATAYFTAGTVFAA